MSRLINTIRNINKIDELKQRILYTLFLVLIYRLGAHVILPGIDPQVLKESGSIGQGGILELINIFSGGAFSSVSILALGIMPYISASIIIQLLTVAVPYFQKLQKEGESGRKKLNQITRYLTVFVVIAQSQGYLSYVTSMIPPEGIYPFRSDITHLPFLFRFSSTILLTAGTLFVMWLGERITDKGIGNGISLLIMVGIIARFPFALVAEFASRLEVGGGGLFVFIVELIVLIVVVVITIMLVQGTRKIPIQFAKRVIGNKQYGGVRQYLPLKVNAAGVMPIIFAQAIMFLPVTIAGYAKSQELSGFLSSMINPDGFWYNLVFAFLIIIFTYFYTAITINPTQMAEELRKNGGFIPGIKPGKPTAEFIDNVMSKITLPGSLFLAFVAIMPALVRTFDVNSQFAQFFGGTSLLILVGVVLDTLQQIESYLLMRHYDGLTKSGRIKGRTSPGMMGY
ncbi:MAG: preprotein translocase subunit SecY [Bacteroidales bacterium]|nr:preprotein translocase subunit SecY [Bacteroidales bacterium]